MTGKITTKQKKEKERSCIAKCGSLIKTILVYGTVAAVVIPIIYTLLKGDSESQSEADRVKNMADQRKMT